MRPASLATFKPKSADASYCLDGSHNLSAESHAPGVRLLEQYPIALDKHSVRVLFQGRTKTRINSALRSK